MGNIPSCRKAILFINNVRYGNEFYVAYRSSPDKLIITKYYAETFSPTNSVEIAVDNPKNDAIAIEHRGNTKFEIQVEEANVDNKVVSNLLVIRTHNNQQGKF